ncbi:hypothetical protein CAPI_08060 [Corynebacterium capitovis DSM 44611]|nr:hypothetical protein CAPI_08060 [Corynebacterium capitovis DSM 44611]
MLSLKPATAVSAATVTALTALLLAGCSAGQITQTSDQVAAVDGASASGTATDVSAQDVTVIVQEDGTAALKFTAFNQNNSRTPHRLLNATVSGAPVALGATSEIPAQCTLVADSADSIESLPKAPNDCIQYVATTVDNRSFAYGGTAPVALTFDDGKLEVQAPVSAPMLPSGQSARSDNQAEAVAESH